LDNKIYIVTSIEPWREKDFQDEELRKQRDSGWLQSYKSSRAVGWFKTLEEAEKRVINNMCDIWEYCYDFADIEETVDGFYPNVIHHWYKFDESTRKYVKLPEMPAEVKPFSNCFAIPTTLG